MPEQPTDDPREVLSAWIDAFNSKDLGHICSLYAADAILWGTFSSSLIASEQGVRDYFARAFEQGLNASAELQGLELQTLGSVAIASGAYLLHANMAGNRRSLPARFTFVLTWRGAFWSIVNHHSSLTPSHP